MRVLVTGGAGFIGSHVVDRLLNDGHDVLVLDSLEPQVHGADRSVRPPHLDPRAKLVVGDVRDRAIVSSVVDGADAIIHLAAAVGLAQSMYEMERFVDVNGRGTAILLEEATKKDRHIKKIVVASSMSLYGEGRCVCTTHGPFDPSLRPEAQLAKHDFEIRCHQCNQVASASPTPEDARLVPTTVYAVTKRDQEDLVLAVGAAYGIATCALRLFNVYGPRQSLSNPYTGVAAIFSSRLLAGNQPIIFEDGHQTRDFTHVSDIAEAFARALTEPKADGVALNVGRGDAYSLRALGELLAGEIGVAWKPEITSAFRKGDIRHCTSDTTRLEQILGFKPRVDFKDGVKDLVSWVRTQKPTDKIDRAMSELTKHGLLS
jgi:dTDP-L-rhamnose 4-epimerase